MTPQEIAYAKTGESAAANHILKSDWLDVGDGQRLYYLEWGTQSGKPFIVLHGGPGAAFNATHVALFDPTQHHVLFFDQRGCGESLPAAGTLTKAEVEAHNTPAHIIADIEKLRVAIFGATTKVTVAGGSWGSTLGLLYAEAHPEWVTALKLWSTFLGQKAEIDEMFTDRAGDASFPHEKAWERFIALVPAERRTAGRSVLEYYAEQISSTDPAVAWKHAFEFELYEDTLCAQDDPSTLIEELETNPNLVSWARIEIVYMLNNMFIEEGRILTNINSIKHIPCTLVHGNRDWCTPLKWAELLKSKYGDNCTLQVVASGHMRHDKEMLQALRAAMLSA